MKITLVNPPLRPDLETYASLKMIAPPIGLAYLAAVLERAKYPVDILDASVNEMSSVKLRQNYRDQNLTL
ncbi:MAG: hypothetical protein ABIH76_02575 [Candidatus Bathyarchaeota archaeon]